MKKTHWCWLLLWLVLMTFAANSYVLIAACPWIALPAAVALVLVHLLSGKRLITFDRLLICRHGMELLILFLISTAFSVLCQAVIAWRLLPEDIWGCVISLLVFVCVEASVFWHGILCVYCTSVQLGVRYRLWGLICGMIPVANLVMLILILRIAGKELRTEQAKEALNESRKEEQVCRTRYPLLMVHGFFFRDSKLINYWGRIPRELEKNGATVFYGEHQSADAVANSAAELMERVEYIVRKTGCEKVNIIAHSKGGLDCRYAMEHLGMAKYVASLTTVNTPHRGCMYAEHLLGKVSPKNQERVAKAYNTIYKRLGDESPDFLAGVRDLTASACRQFETMPDPEGVYCQSVGSVMEKARRGKFPVNVTYRYVKRFDGANDGLVAETAFSWGEKYTLVTTKGKRGISHGDMIDLNRENIEDFDVREFYVQLVSALKQKGL